MYSAPHVAFRANSCHYLRQDGDLKGLVVVFTHKIEGDDWEDVPRRQSSLPTHQLLSEPESSRKLLSLKKKEETITRLQQADNNERTTWLVCQNMLMSKVQTDSNSQSVSVNT